MSDIYHLLFALNDVCCASSSRCHSQRGDGGKRGRGVQFKKAFGVTLFWWDSTPGNPADTPGEKAGRELFLSESDSRDCGGLDRKSVV